MYYPKPRFCADVCEDTYIGKDYFRIVVVRTPTDRENAFIPRRDLRFIENQERHYVRLRRSRREDKVQKIFYKPNTPSGYKCVFLKSSTPVSVSFSLAEPPRRETLRRGIFLNEIQTASKQPT